MPGEEKPTVDEKTAGRKRPPAIPPPKSTRPTRAVKAARRTYSPPPPNSTPSSAARRAIKPPTQPKVKIIPPPPPPVVIIKPAKEQQPARPNRDNVKRKLNTVFNTVEGQVAIINRANRDDNFARALVSSLNQHAEKVVDNVRAKRNKIKTYKMTKAMQMQEMKHSKKIDINTPDSLLVNMPLSTIINRKNFEKLPSFYQYKLTQMLPKCDQTLLPNDVICPSDTSFKNEFFSRALETWSTRLADGRLTNENVAKLKREMERDKKNLDPWKVKHFEPFFKEPEDAPEEDMEKKKHKQDMDFLNTMNNCYTVVDSIVRNKPSALASMRPLVHFDGNATRTADGYIQSVEPLNDTNDSKKFVKPTARYVRKGKGSVKFNDSGFPILEAEKKADAITEELITNTWAYTDSAEICQKLYNTEPPKTAPHLISSSRELAAGGRQSVLNSLPDLVPTSNNQFISASNSLTMQQKQGQPRVIALRESYSPLKIIQPPPAPKMSLQSFIRQPLPQSVILHLPLSNPSSLNRTDWPNYFQSLFFMNAFVTKFHGLLHRYGANYEKLSLSAIVLFNPMEYLGNSCVGFLRNIPKSDEGSKVRIHLEKSIPLLGIPEEVTASLDAIERISEPCLTLQDTCQGEYLKIIDLAMIKKMDKRCSDMIMQFNNIFRQICTVHEVNFLEHYTYLRGMHSLRIHTQTILKIFTPVNENSQILSQQAHQLQQQYVLCN